MIRIGEIRSARLGAASLAMFALMVLALARPAAAQTTPAPADVLKFNASTPALILIQIHADKAADFESAWASIRTAFGKVTDAPVKAFGETLKNLSKVDQPPIDIGGTKVVLYVLQLDAPSTAYTYNPVAVVYELLWKNGAADAAMTRAEADAVYEKLKSAFQSINPPWKLTKVG